MLGEEEAELLRHVITGLRGIMRLSNTLEVQMALRERTLEIQMIVRELIGAAEDRLAAHEEAKLPTTRRQAIE